MDYPLMETPFILVPFKEMNKKQVEQYFNWFIQEKEKRMTQLEICVNQEIKSVVLDKTPESLIPLWDWFESHIEWEDKTEEELKDELVGRPEWMYPHILVHTKKATILTMALERDIAIYFAETLINNHPNIYWGYRMKPKRLDGVNQPILLGFKGDISVNYRRLVNVCLLKSSRKKDKNQLYELYNIWCENV